MQFYIVSGGYSSSYLASTEILKKNGGTSWAAVASLPTTRIYISGVSLPDGHFLVSGEGYFLSTTTVCSIQLMIHHYTGGYDGSYMTEVLLYDPEADQWTPVGQLATARGEHAMSLVPKETADYCV